ncbi:DUF6325 family protein [Gordonia hankookensis]|uniref:DUF1269 domain-containing protein n=1 Tax=Gordonia hankookensis TaxID=589403 RepID=A0ABR7W5B3_9ACTN|nr:DUF6325 family protein [Gordonia hankookensis]MBD1318024.1 DUF1269 domain-containing protein [Gordonia hankookensis]
MTEEAAQELGPIDYVVLEWPDKQPTGEAIPYLIDLVDRGVIRIIDLAFVMKDEDGSITQIELDQLGADFEVFDGVATDLISTDDVSEAASVLQPGTAAAILVYENAWAAGFAAALRRNGGQMVSAGRIPMDEFLETLDAAEA